MSEADKKPIYWVGTSRKDLSGFPDEVRDEIGFAIYQAELGERHASAKTMKVLDAVEIVSDYDGDTFRGVYTTKYKGVLFVLHCFMKKSKNGIKTPKAELDLIKKRLKDAKKIYDSI